MTGHALGALDISSTRSTNIAVLGKRNAEPRKFPAATSRFRDIDR